MSEIDLEEYLARFEAAYSEMGHADLVQFLPPAEHPRYDEIVVELIRCDLELSWKHRSKRSLDEYRNLFPLLLGKSRFLEQVAFEEYRLRTQSGESVSARDYQQKYGIKSLHWPDLNEPAHNIQHLETETTPDLPNGRFDSEDEIAIELSARLGSGGIPDITTVEGRLHQRLRFISLTFSLVMVYMAALVSLNPEQKVGLFLGSPILIGLNLACLGVCIIIGIYLWFRPAVGMTQLRYLELGLFGLVLLELSLGLYSDLFIDHELVEPLGNDHALFHFASSWSLPFFALIVAYGTLVPSSWPRCTIVVSVIAFTPIVICLLAAREEGGLTQSFFQSFLMQMALWMGMAAAIAIYGVHRLETLERRFLKSGKLGKYRLIKRLGSGAMGSIYLAEDTLLQRPCAVKLMLHHARDPKLFSRFEREVQVLAAISHANIVQIFDVGHSAAGIFYFVMEYLHGFNLEELLRKRGTFGPRQVVNVIRQISEALERVHQCQLVHRDVKPSNIFACDSETAENYKLLDFGLVKTTVLRPEDDQLTKDGAIIGTPAFMSPEQASGESLDLRSDIYSLGAVGYYLLTGKAPFDKNTVVETLSAHIHEQPTSLHEVRPDCPDDLARVISRCLSKKPSDRFESMDELRAALPETISPKK